MCCQDKKEDQGETTFTHRGPDGVTVTVHLDHTDWTWVDLEAHFRSFLRGVGYVIPDESM